MSSYSRRQFIVSCAAAAGAVTSTSLLAGEYFSPVNSIVAGAKQNRQYDVPVKAEDPFVTISALVTPEDAGGSASIKWQFATDEHFENIINEDEVHYNLEDNMLFNITLESVPAGSQLYYRFIYDNCHLTVGSDEAAAAPAVNYTVYPQQQVTRDLLSYRRKSSEVIDKTLA